MKNMGVIEDLKMNRQEQRHSSSTNNGLLPRDSLSDSDIDSPKKPTWP